MSVTDCNCAALREASRVLTRAYDEALAPAGVGINQFSVLARLNRLGPLVLQDLARALVMDRSTLGHLLRPLEKRGLVALTPGVTDGRCRVVSLTPAGATLVHQARPLWAAMQERFETAFGAGRAEALRTTLAGVLDIPPTVLSADAAPPPSHEAA